MSTSVLLKLTHDAVFKISPMEAVEMRSPRPNAAGLRQRRVGGAGKDRARSLSAGAVGARKNDDDDDDDDDTVVVRPPRPRPRNTSPSEFSFAKKRPDSVKASFRALFGDEVPEDDELLNDFSCAIQRGGILLQGRLYVTARHLCFFSNIFGHRERVVLPLSGVRGVEKRTTVRLFKNALRVHAADGSQLTFRSFFRRNRVFRMLSTLLEWNCPPGTPRHRRRPADGAKDESHPAFPFRLERQLTMREFETEAVVRRGGGPGGGKKGGAEELSRARLLEEDDEAEDDEEGRLAAARDPDSSGSDAEGGGDRGMVLRAQLRMTAEERRMCEEEDDGRQAAGAPPEDDSAGVEMEEMFSCEFDAPVEEMFVRFFSDRATYSMADFHEARGDRDIALQPWVRHPEIGFTRNLQVRVPVASPLPGYPSWTRLLKLQRYRFASVRGSTLLIDVTCSTMDVPYATSFSMLSQLELAPVEGRPGACRMSATYGVRFLKRVWGVGGLIRSRSLEEHREDTALWASKAAAHLAEQRARERQQAEAGREEEAGGEVQAAAATAAAAAAEEEEEDEESTAKPAERPGTAAPPVERPASPPVLLPPVSPVHAPPPRVSAQTALLAALVALVLVLVVQVWQLGAQVASLRRQQVA